MQELASVGWCFLCYIDKDEVLFQDHLKCIEENIHVSSLAVIGLWCFITLCMNIILTFLENYGILVCLKHCCKHITAKIYTHYNLKHIFHWV